MVKRSYGNEATENPNAVREQTGQSQLEIHFGLSVVKMLWKTYDGHLPAFTGRVVLVAKALSHGSVNTVASPQ